MGDLELPRAEDGLAPDRTLIAAGLVVREWGGGGDFAPVLFWPSLNPWGGLQLVEVGPLLAARGHRVLAIAPPGGGDSPAFEDPDAYRPTRLAERVIAVADELGLDRFSYIGASWGASIGVHLGARHPDRVKALVLLDGGHVDITVDKTLDELVAEFEADQEGFAFDSWDAFFARVRERVRSWRPSLEPRYREAMTERGGKIVPRATARAAAWAVYGVVIEPPSTAHPELSVPVLLVLADGKRSAESESRFEKAVPHARLAVVHSGHDVVEDAPAETVALVADWLG